MPRLAVTSPSRCRSFAMKWFYRYWQ